MQTVTLSVDDEIKTLGDGIATEVADIKAAKGTAVYLADAMPILLAIAGKYQALPADIKKPDDIAYLVDCLAKAFLPAA